MKNFRSPQRPKKSTLLAGINAIDAALKDGVAIDKILVQKDGYRDVFEQARKLSVAAGVPLQVVPVQKLDSFNAGAHGGCIAIKSQVSYKNLADVLSQLMDGGTAPLLLMLDGVTDVRNIGGMARTAYALGVDALIIPEKGVGALNEDAVLTSAGALRELTVCRVPSLLKAVDDMHLHGIQVAGTQMRAEKKLDDMNFSEPLCIIMGGEEKGIHPALLKACDYTFSIPMHNNFESLNVSVSTGIILYKAAVQRAKKTDA